MIPVHLQLSGFLSYCDPVEVDFTRFDLACISGSNGAGKSSLLDAFTWCLFGEARRRDDSVINNQSNAAEVILDFDYEGNRYRVQRTKPRDKTTLLEFQIRTSEGAWRSLTEATMRATEERIRQTLRLDYETFINSSFFLQGKADQFAQQRPGERKRILSSILGLDIWEKYREEAVRLRRIEENEITRLNGSLDEIGRELGNESTYRLLLDSLSKELDELDKTRTARQTLLDQSNRLFTQMEERRASQLRQKALINDLARDLQEKSSRRDALQNDLLADEKILSKEGDIRTAHAAWLQLRDELMQLDQLADRYTALASKRHALELVIEQKHSALEEEYRQLQKQQNAVQVQSEQHKTLQGELAIRQKTILSYQEECAKRPEAEAQLALATQSAAELAEQNRQYRKEMDQLKKRLDSLQEAESAACPVCGQNLSETKRQTLIDELSEEGKVLGDRFRENQARIVDWTNVKTTAEDLLRNLDSLQKKLLLEEKFFSAKQEELRNLENNLQEWSAGSQPRAEALEEILQTGAYEPETQENLRQLDEEMSSLGYIPATHQQKRQREQADRDIEEQMRLLEIAHTRRKALQKQHAELVTEIATLESRVASLQQEYARIETDLQQMNAGLPTPAEAETEYNRALLDFNAKQREVHQQTSRLENLSRLRQEQSAREQEKEQHMLSTSQLKMLEKAFSKDGIPALLIEQALPEIEAQANDILNRLSGNGMSVRFETQREYKDRSREDRKETLDILIQDASGQREYELFSGGETFRINFAIRLALSYLLARRAGARLQTLVIDEGFGSQDAQGRQRLIQAINLVRPDFAKILVITHLEELKEAFPARIEVLKTPRGSVVEVMAL